MNANEPAQTPTDRVLATYAVETPLELEKAAAVMAGEQSVGTFTKVHGETRELWEKHGARIERVVPKGTTDRAGLPGGAKPDPARPLYNRGDIVLSFPVHNFGVSIPNLMAAVAGNLFELRQFTGLRLMDLDLPQVFADKYKGPRFGVSGTRHLAGVPEKRPLIGTIVKPSIGLTVEALKELVKTLAEAGLDFIKDDELNADPPLAPLEKKVPAVMDQLSRIADKSGKKVMYAFNITGDIDELRRRHDLVRKHGGTCVMVSINSIGLAGLAYLSSFCELPIHGHRNQFGMMTRFPQLGIDFVAYQKLCRLAGADHLHVNGIGGKFYESDESVERSVQACRQPMFGGYEVMPVLSSGQTALSAAPSWEKLGTFDVLHLAGGGILGHPGGVAAGVASMRQSWEAAIAGIPLSEYAATRPELKQAIAAFGKS